MQNVVWEKLDDLTGNTQFLKADFMPYGSTSLSEQVSDAADLVQAAFAGNAPTKARPSSGGGPLPLAVLQGLPSFNTFHTLGPVTHA